VRRCNAASHFRTEKAIYRRAENGAAGGGGGALIISFVCMCYVEASGEVDGATCVREHSDGRGRNDGQINDLPSPPGPAACCPLVM
jgi:hypothetical protein